ncbi:MAG TPA: phosphatase PAP2 family protein [Myxococcota bacterium]|jgi:membrane-associated phospholipid phosphatase|nr:phosphatase PAP2 family protein [Myxococcota bacterium]
MREPPEDAPAEKLALAAMVVLLWVAGYFGAAARIDPTAARVLRTPVDDAIPFLPATIYLYTAVYTAMLLPLFTVRCKRLFRRVVAAYGLVLAASLLCFVTWPVTSLGLRPDPSLLDRLSAVRFDVWGVRLCYALDPPVNLFPSLHLASVTLVALTAGTARRSYGAVGLVLVAGVGASICTVKQHWVVDGLAGLALGGGAWALVVRPYARPREPGVAYGMGGPLSFGLLHGSALLVLYALFASGFRPWDR